MELSQKGSVPVMDFLFTLLILCDVILLNKNSGISKSLDPLNIKMLMFMWLKKKGKLFKNPV